MNRIRLNHAYALDRSDRFYRAQRRFYCAKMEALFIEGTLMTEGTGDSGEYVSNATISEIIKSIPVIGSAAMNLGSLAIVDRGITDDFLKETHWGCWR